MLVKQFVSVLPMERLIAVPVRVCLFRKYLLLTDAEYVRKFLSPVLLGESLQILRRWKTEYWMGR